ncbi:response regulator with -like receiver domain protein and winged-helix dna-binding domain protein [Leptolyngbya sp. Heron Island J]|uniref:two-component system response regulator RppA n=1 Tax=Leptolyngbya sp. Heron Island J TaxID=1385935 RepID=UPI0003B9AA05|nr:two-component system response regulator RppA [Leptolyngbya sp. Heron Island J]ESA33765.1 response regulator with -like receiver domain protein and winged-helix dna-binding domain protein [Leptolyngbya sp. Heron Island J]
MRILLVDDEVELTEPLSRVLQREGYNVKIAHDGETGYKLAVDGEFDLLILDWMMPGLSGLEMCRKLREHHLTTPVLFLTAKDTLDDRVEGLDAGADDYLVKPFELRELLARVRALLRRPPIREEVPTTILQYRDLTLDSANQIAKRGGDILPERTIELSEKESQILSYLMQYPDQLLTHQQIYDTVWGTSAQPSSNALAAQMRLLRRKVEHNGETTLIHTVYGKGYRFGSPSESV